MDATPQEVLNELQRLYPEQVKIAVLTVVNRKQAELINQQNDAIKHMDPLLVRNPEGDQRV